MLLRRGRAFAVARRVAHGDAVESIPGSSCGGPASAAAAARSARRIAEVDHAARCAANRGEWTRALRPGRERQLTRCQRSQGGATAGTNSRGDRGPLRSQPWSDTNLRAARPRALGELPLHAPRHRTQCGRCESDGCVADPVRRARVQCEHVRGPGHRFDTCRSSRGNHRSDRCFERPAARRGEREGRGHLDGGGRHAGDCRGLDSRGTRPQGTDHGLRPPRLQDRRRAGGHSQDLRTQGRGSRRHGGVGRRG